MDDPASEWYMGQPVVTRTYLTGTFLLACLVSLKMISPFSLFYTFDSAIMNL